VDDDELEKGERDLTFPKTFSL